MYHQGPAVVVVPNTNSERGVKSGSLNRRKRCAFLLGILGVLFIVLGIVFISLTQVRKTEYPTQNPLLNMGIVQLLLGILFMSGCIALCCSIHRRYKRRLNQQRLRTMLMNEPPPISRNQDIFSDDEEGGFGDDATMNKRAEIPSPFTTPPPPRSHLVPYPPPPPPAALDPIGSYPPPPSGKVSPYRLSPGGGLTSYPPSPSERISPYRNPPTQLGSFPPSPSGGVPSYQTSPIRPLGGYLTCDRLTSYRRASSPRGHMESCPPSPTGRSAGFNMPPGHMGTFPRAAKLAASSPGRNSPYQLSPGERKRSYTPSGSTEFLNRPYCRFPEAPSLQIRSGYASIERLSRRPRNTQERHRPPPYAPSYDNPPPYSP
ncbi:uncharacterized protein [Macrobrachium rosenbergii]|uniref:uncharacterized protein n=1 Tax=Macrobrachium rosenbergii TaxID=79674 RepID=UPI0034D7AE37